MKKIIFSLFFLSMMVVGAQAQKASCAKSCTKSAATSAHCQEKAPSAASTASFNNSDAAMKVASMDASIESRKDAATGNTYYVRKETCAHSGTVSYVDVAFDANTNTFVNVSPVKAAGSAGGSGCGSKATSASGKACCATGASAGKSCCAGKGAAASKNVEKVKS